MLTGIDGEGFVNELRKSTQDICQLQEEKAGEIVRTERRDEPDLLANIFPSPIATVCLPIVHPMTRVWKPAK